MVMVDVDNSSLKARSQPNLVGLIWRSSWRQHQKHWFWYYFIVAPTRDWFPHHRVYSSELLGQMDTGCKCIRGQWSRNTDPSEDNIRCLVQDPAPQPSLYPWATKQILSFNGHSDATAKVPV